MSLIAFDYNKVKQLADAMKENPPSEGEFLGDPQGVLSRYGIMIDDEMKGMIQDRLRGANSAQASVMHIDVG